MSIEGISLNIPISLIYYKPSQMKYLIKYALQSSFPPHYYSIYNDIIFALMLIFFVLFLYMSKNAHATYLYKLKVHNLIPLQVHERIRAKFGTVPR